MDKIIYTRPDGGLSVIVPATKKSLEKSLGSLTDAEYEAHVRERSIPDDAVTERSIKPEDMPVDREFRNAWCDVTPESRIDIDCTKAKDIQLEKMRRERDELFEPLDKEFMLALEKGQDTKAIAAKKEALRNATDPLKNLKTDGKFNDEAILNSIRTLGVINKG